MIKISLSQSIYLKLKKGEKEWAIILIIQIKKYMTASCILESS